MKVTYYSLFFLFAFVADNFALNTPKLPADSNLLTNLWANYYESKFAPTPKKEQSNNEELKAKARDYLAAQP
ncbi:MAG: hypothetical protein ACK50A_05065, partial [Sphingobacteriaceae bacterium]